MRLSFSDAALFKDPFPLHATYQNVFYTSPEAKVLLLDHPLNKIINHDGVGRSGHFYNSTYSTVGELQCRRNGVHVTVPTKKIEVINKTNVKQYTRKTNKCNTIHKNTKPQQIIQMKWRATVLQRLCDGFAVGSRRNRALRGPAQHSACTLERLCDRLYFGEIFITSGTRVPRLIQNASGG